ncbi:S8 family serine peptidase [Streptomyces sp. NPDC127068]|uniref:S8 family serine peptidase n=1 Tax=Streptomyces sp. NPDC127068 TaxID=3347127 RepID=UPI00365B31F4
MFFGKAHVRRTALLGMVLGMLAMGAVPQAHAGDVQSQQWYLAAMRAQEMWKISTGEGVKVAVLDTGVNPRVPSLRGKVLADEVPAAAAYGATRDYQGHGTSMAELIVGSGADGSLRGLAPDARVVPIRVDLESLKDEDESKKTSSVAEGIRAAADTDVRIISLSLGGQYSFPDLKSAVKYAASKGKLIFSAGGNSGPGQEFNAYPAEYIEAIGIGAADKAGAVGKFSQKGDYIDLASPGVNVPVWCDETFTRYCPSRGTSQATAIASASAALIWSVHPEWTAHQVLRTLIDTAGRDWARNNPSNYLGYGLIRPRLVLEDPDIDPGPADVNPITNEKTPIEGAEPSVDESPSVPSNKPTDSEAGQAPKGSPSEGSPAEGDNGANGPTASADKDNGGINFVPVLGAVAGLAVLGGGAYVFLRKRRNA